MLPDNEHAEAPENFNREQDDESQAPDIEVSLREDPVLRPGESDRAQYDDTGNILPDDVPDLIDKMDEMYVTGRIDTDAYAGEPVHDDEENMLGNTEDEGDDRDDLTVIDDEPSQR